MSVRPFTSPLVEISSSTFAVVLEKPIYDWHATAVMVGAASIVVFAYGYKRRRRRWGRFLEGKKKRMEAMMMGTFGGTQKKRDIHNTPQGTGGQKKNQENDEKKSRKKENRGHEIEVG